MNIPKIMETQDGQWTLGSVERFSISDAIALTQLGGDGSHVAPLGGRSPVVIHEMPDVGRLVIKRYLRGGMLNRFLGDRYFKLAPCRARTEFEILLRAASPGINVPEPLAFLQRGKWIYQCWLMTRFVPNRGTLAQISKGESSIECMGQVADQTRQMIDHGIYHVDFHPGNVILGEDGRVYLLDFDKAVVTNMSKSRLRTKYVKRWNRAVLKHGLSHSLLNPSF